MSIDIYETQNKSLKNGIINILPRILGFYNGNSIMDVGSNTGMFIECMLENFPMADILAFEPVRRYFEYSAARYKQNKNVRIENYALSDKTCADYIYVANDNIGWNTLVKEMIDPDNASGAEKIQCLNFDEYYAKNSVGIIDILKIDTEGFEYKVLAGMRNFLLEQKPAIICEVGWGKNHPHWKEELEMFDYLYSIGYSNEQSDYIKNLEATTDVIFTV